MLAGARIGNFQIVSRLGRGGMGEVWLAEHAVGTRVAIKLLLPEISEDVEHVQRFFNEARAVARVQHAGIVRIFDVGHAHDRTYLIMELLEGEPLSRRIRRGPLGVAQACAIGRQIASVLEATHAAGITHRDLKPDNLFLVPDREAGVRVKVLDFGIAKLTGTLAGASPRTVGMLGTPAYMAPEQWGDASRVDGRADLYSLGCVLFEMLTGRPPFVMHNLADACAKHLHEPPPRLARVPAPLAELVAGLLAKQPAQRPSVRDVVRVLAAPLDQTALADTVAPAPGRRRRWPAAIAALAALGVLPFVMIDPPVAEALSLDVAAGPVELELEESITRRVEPPPRAARRESRRATMQTRPVPPVIEPTVQVVQPPPEPTADLPIAPTDEEVLRVVRALQPAVMKCATPETRDWIILELLIMPSGRLGRAQPVGNDAHTVHGECAADAVLKARFPASKRGRTQALKFKLR